MLTNNRLLIDCDAHCGALAFTKFGAEFDEMGAVYIDVYSSLYMEKQTSWARSLWTKLKAIWSIVRGKDYLLYDLLITSPEKMQQIGTFFTDAAKESRTTTKTTN